MRVVRGHEGTVRFGRLDGDLAVGVGRGGEQFAAELRAVEAVAGELVALGGEHLAVPVQVAGRVHGPLARVLVELGVQRVHDLPLVDLRVGAVGRDDGAVELVEEGAVLVHASAVDAFAADLDGHILGRVDWLERVGYLVGLTAQIVGDLDGLVLHDLAVLDLGDLVRQDHLVFLAEQVLVDAWILRRVELPGGVFLEVGRLRVALHGLAGRGDLGVHGLREHIGHAVLELDVELGGHVLAGGVEHFDLGLVDVQVLLVIVVDEAETLHLVGGGVLGEVLRIQGQDVVAGVAQQQCLPVDADGAVLAGHILLLRGELRRLVVHLVRRGERIVQGQPPLVADLVVGGRVLGHGALEANEHARVLALAPVGLHVLIVEAETEGMVGVIPSGLVPLLRDGLAGQEVSDLEGLLVRLEVRVERVGHGHVVGEVPGQFRLGGQLVFDLLAGEHDLALDAVLVAALAGFGHDVLLDRGHIAADLRLVRADGLVVDDLGAAVGQLVAVLAGGAERGLVALADAHVLADLGRALAVGHVDDARHEQGDLLRLGHAGQLLQVAGLGGGGDLGALDGDVVQGGHVLALRVDAVDGGLGRGVRVGLVHADRAFAVRVEQVVGVRVVVLDGEGLQLVGHEVLLDGGVDRAGDLVAVEEVVVVGAGLVGLGRVGHELPALAVPLDPALVRVRLPGRELVAVGVLVLLLGDALPEHVALVLDLAGLRRGHGHVERELEVMVVGQVAAVPGGGQHVAGRCGPVRGVERVGAGHVLVGGLVGDLQVGHGVLLAVRVERVLEVELGALPAGLGFDGRGVRHRVRADALGDVFGRRDRRRVDRWLVLVEDDGDDGAWGLRHLTRGERINIGLTIREIISGLISDPLIVIGGAGNAGRLVSVSPLLRVEAAVGARVPVAGLAGRVHEAHGHESAFRILVAGGLRTGHAFVVRVGHGLVDGAVRFGAVHRLHTRGLHRGLHVLTGRGAEGVLVHPADLSFATGGAITGACAGAGPAAAIGRERAGDRRAQGRRGDHRGQSGFAPFLVLVGGTQCSFSFQRFLPADSSPAYAGRGWDGVGCIPRSRPAARPDGGPSEFQDNHGSDGQTVHHVYKFSA